MKRNDGMTVPAEDPGASQGAHSSPVPVVKILEEAKAETARRDIVANIKDVAEKNGLQIHPGQTPENWAELVIKKGGCPCVPGRAKCPCDQVMEDIRKKDHCGCYLFCNDRYMRTYREVMAMAKRKPTAEPAPG